jgi:putative ABC transport system permease protein
MTYLRLIWAYLWRAPARTLFTGASIAVAFVLFGVLQGVNATFDHMAGAARPDLLLTASPSGLPLPFAAAAAIRKVPGVTRVSWRSGFMGYFQAPRNAVLVAAVEPQDVLLALPPESSVSAGARSAFERTRTGALVSARLAQRLHWKIGDHLPVRAPGMPQRDGSTVWTFDIVGIYTSRSNPGQQGLLMSYPYFDASRAAGGGTVDMYIEQVADPARATVLAAAIDERFGSSSDPTRTDTERGLVQTALNEIGDLALFADLIIGAAFATLLMLTGSSLMQSFRERIPELAVLKTLGFRDTTVAGLVLGEALLLYGGAAAAGLAGAAAILAGMGGASGGDLPALALRWEVAAYGAAAAALIALVSALPPAWRAGRLTISGALARG